MSAFFTNIAVTFALCLVQEETVKNWLLSQKCPQAGSVCKQKKQKTKHVPIGGKRHHHNQVQNYMAKRDLVAEKQAEW